MPAPVKNWPLSFAVTPGKVMFLTCLLAVISLLIAFSIAGKDIPPVDVSDLHVQAIVIADEDNAYFDYMAAADTLSPPQSDNILRKYLRGAPVDVAALTALLDNDRESLIWVQRGNSKQHCVFPEIHDFTDPTPYLTTWFKLSLTLAASARHQRLRGDASSATDTSLALVAFGEKVHVAPDGLMHYLVGVAILSLGRRQLEDLARDVQTPEAKLQQIIVALESLNSFGTGLQRAMKVEFRLFANTVMKIANGHIPLEEFNAIKLPVTSKILPGYFFQPEQTKATAAMVYRGIIDLLGQSRFPGDTPNMEHLLGLNVPKWKRVVRPNSMGTIFLGMLAPTLDSVVYNRYKSETEVSATRLLAACHLYHRRHGKFPDALEALVPDILPSIPRDPFDGEPFRYHREHNVLYSVGRNQRDDLNVDYKFDPKDRWNQPNAVFPLEATLLTPPPSPRRTNNLTTNLQNSFLPLTSCELT